MVLLFMISNNTLQSQGNNGITLKPDSARWVDSVFHSLTLEEKIGQMFMVAAYSNRDKKHLDDLSGYVRDNKIGGLIFFQGGPIRQALMTNHLQSISKTPMFIAIDGEWGLSMRLDSTFTFPKQMTLGAASDDSLVYYTAAQIAMHCRRMGIQIDFAPVADINNNPENPVISNRSFGESKDDVIRKSLMYMYGLQNNGVMAVAKHFPGHGDTKTDSHFNLPVILYDKKRLDSLEIAPFKSLIDTWRSGYNDRPPEYSCIGFNKGYTCIYFTANYKKAFKERTGV